MGFFDKIKKGLEKTRRQMGGLFAEFTGENEEFYEELEDSLILADAGAAAASRAVAQLREKVRDESLLGQDEVRAALETWAAENTICISPGSAQRFALVTAEGEEPLGFAGEVEPLTVGTAERFVQDFLAARPGAAVDYIHGEAAVRQLSWLFSKK